MKAVIVPDSLNVAINSRLDNAIAECPDAAKDREIFYNQLLEYFDGHGELPEFSIVKNEQSSVNLRARYLYCVSRMKSAKTEQERNQWWAEAERCKNVTGGLPPVQPH